MQGIVSMIVVCILLLGTTFWIWNNDDGLGDGIDDGARTVSEKVEQFDYSHTTAPGAGHNNEMEDNQAD
ncbi:hypothetical protein [Brevibacillus brevis]|uniref:Uncharacterized protein n=1 Tax=Brevibacillus brevis TaxID=1393 RepID=A0ABY9TD46_BREBE|nr:hypothetical protein [Brevibacillus brevis]WNC17898.1 hypothetical protein RGB73_30480 [Brevibacillus brevis]